MIRNILIFSSMVLIFCHVKFINSANILVVTPLPSPSHFKSFQPLLEELVDRGHNVTLIAGFKLNVHSNYTLVDIKPYFNKLNVVFVEMGKQSKLQNLMFLNNVVQNYIEEVFKSTEVQDIISSNHSFDLVIAEMFFFDTIFAFGYKFNAPIIALSAQIMVPFYCWILGSPFSPSYIPNSYLPLTEKMSLVSRIVNVAFNFFSVLYYEFVSLPTSQMQIEKYFHFDKENVPHIKDIMKNISVIFLNTHYSFGYIKPELPSVINVAGLHFTPRKSLPKNIQNFMDEAEHGVIYISLGSLIEPSYIEHLGKTFIRLLENIPQRVVMKWDSKLLSHIPTNILVQKWIPQADVLHHPKCLIFITHGGLHSLLESLNASVPLIGIPFFGDQQYNMAIVEYYRMGITLQNENIPKELLSKVDAVLHNPEYKENIEKRSLLFRERLTNPLETAVYWVDHVIKHKNTAHLKSASSQLTWYELYSLDVLTILIISTLIIIQTVKVVIGKIMQKLMSMKTKVHSNKKPCQKKEVKLINNLKYD